MLSPFFNRVIRGFYNEYKINIPFFGCAASDACKDENSTSLDLRFIKYQIVMELN